LLIKALRLVLVGILLCGLAACNSPQRTVILERLSDGNLVLQDLCGIGMLNVAVYRRPIDGPTLLQERDVEWSASVPEGGRPVLSMTLFRAGAGYEVVEKNQSWPPSYDFAVIVDHYDQYYNVQDIKPGSFEWDSQIYEGSSRAQVARAMEERSAGLQGKCHP
jgi:hypothetical protein